jgi:hypothetical protein
MESLQKSETALVESVQKRFTKSLFIMKGLQYSERLKLLNAESLEMRRLKFDLFMYYKIIFNLTDVPTDEFFILKNGITRNNGLCISLNKFHYNAERYYFRNRCVNVWNSLPNYVVNSACLNDFKRSLSVIDLSRFLKNRYDIGNFNNWNNILLYMVYSIVCLIFYIWWLIVYF